MINAKDITMKVSSGGIITHPDDTPDQFTLADQTNVTTSTLIESSPIVLSGMDSFATAQSSVDIGEQQINAAAWTSSSANVTNGDAIRVRHTSSASQGTQTDQVLTVGNVQDTFSLTTENTQSAQLGTITAGSPLTHPNNNIRWTFNQNVEYGGFGNPNQDRYIVHPGGTLTLVTVEYNTGSSWVNGGATAGTMISPNGNGSQGLSSSAPGHSGALNVATSLPTTLSIDDSVLSAGNPRTPGGNLSVIEDCECLCVLGAHATQGDLRPPWAGTDRTINFNISDIDYGVLANDTAEPGAPSWTNIESVIQRPWVHFGGMAEWQARSHHPFNNMRDYSRDMLGESGPVMAMLNTSATNATKANAAAAICQLGIDLYQVYLDGCITFRANGGQGNGWKAPIVIAGALLGDASMRDIGYATHVEAGDVLPIFGEDGIFYVTTGDIASFNYGDPYESGTVTSANGGTAIVDSGASFVDGAPTSANGVLAGQIVRNTTTGATAVTTGFTSSTQIPHSQLTGGTRQNWQAGDSYEISDLAMPEWKFDAFPSTYTTGATRVWDTGGYRNNQFNCCTGWWWFGELYAIEAMGLISNWGHQATFDYLERFYYVEDSKGKITSWQQAQWAANHSWGYMPAP